MIRVVIAEDQQMVLGALAALLDLEPDIRVVAQAKDGAEALELVRREKPDVLLTDIGLPGLSGMDLVESLRARHKLEVIFATGRPPPETPIPDSYWLQKPFTFEQLESVLARVMPRAEA